MIHETARRLDEPPMFLGLNFPQWAGFLAGGVGVGAGLHFTHVATRPAVTLWMFVVLLPLGLSRMTEDGRMRPGRLLLDMGGYLRRRQPLAAGPAQRTVGLLVTRSAGAEDLRTADQTTRVEIPW